jgi:hypothetical protein
MDWFNAQRIGIFRGKFMICIGETREGEPPGEPLIERLSRSFALPNRMSEY